MPPQEPERAVGTQLPTVSTLDQLAELTERSGQGAGLFIRWSKGPDVDEGSRSSDDLTGSQLPGLSANPLAVEPWWEGPLRLWIARRLHDYCHLEHEKGPGVRPWVLEGEELGRGPDNEPLVRCVRPVAWIAEELIAEADAVMREQNAEWGPLRRPASEG